jgi:hypothetical protein
MQSTVLKVKPLQKRALISQESYFHVRPQFATRDNRAPCLLQLLMNLLSDLAQKELRRIGDEKAIAETH